MHLHNTIAGLMFFCLLPFRGRSQTPADTSRHPAPLDSLLPHFMRRPLYDTAYYRLYPRDVTFRIYTSRKYTRLLISEPEGTLKYRPNTPPNVGIGATYSFLTINLAAGLGFFAPTQDKGKTHYLDLQTHGYFPKLSVDLFGQFYRGYYISDHSFPGQTEDYYRPDLKVAFVGAAAYYILNAKHFSLASSMSQSEWQQHSAGSLLLGWEVYYGSIRGDSALAPGMIPGDSSSRQINGVHFFEMGPGVGYAYTFVYKRHYFFTGGVTVSGAVGYNREYGMSTYDRVGIVPNVTYRASTGYNGNVWSAGAYWINNQEAASGTLAYESYKVKNGVFGVTLARRFKLTPRIRKKLDNIPQKVQNAITP